MRLHIQKAFHYFHPLVWIILAGTVFTRTASFMAVPFLALYLLNTLHASPYLIGLALGIAPLFSTIGGFIGGYLTDRFGRSTILMMTVFVWSLTFIGFSVVQSVYLFIILNAINGLCRSFFEPGTQALMIDFTEDDKKRRLFSIRYTAINIAAVIGPLLGVYIASLSNAALPFFITGVMYALYGFFLLFVLRRYKMRQQRLAAGTTMLAVLRVVALDKKLLFILIGGTAIAIGHSQFDSTLPQLINMTVTDGVQLFSMLIAVNALTVLLCQLPISMFAERFAVTTSLYIGITLFALGLMLFGFAQNATFFIIAMIVFSIGEVLTFPMMQAMVEEIAPNDKKATYLGASQLRNIGGFVGPIVGGALLVEMPHLLYPIIAGCVLCSISMYYRAFQTTPHDQ